MRGRLGREERWEVMFLWGKLLKERGVGGVGGELCFLGRVGWCWCMGFSVFGVWGDVWGVRRGRSEGG